MGEVIIVERRMGQLLLLRLVLLWLILILWLVLVLLEIMMLLLNRSKGRICANKSICRCKISNGCGRN